MKSSKTILGSLLVLGLSYGARALPQDPSPVHGQVRIENGANFVQILQQTPQAIINWGQFNIGLGETVRFLQPGQQSAILNRVTGMDPSVIQGMLQANGRVFLLNPNGILFGPNSVVDVGSFTASTLKMSDEDFLNGSYKLTQDNTLPLAALTNQGTIRVAEGGFVVLVSPLLDNQGMILAQSGHVNLGATTQATFSVDGRGLVQFVVPDGFDPKFQGGGQGGTVLLQPGQMSQLLSQVVTNPTLIEAGSFQPGANGQVLAQGAEGLLLNSGTISTDSSGGNGGTIRLDSSQATILPSGGRLTADSQSADGGDVRLLSAGRTVSLGTISAAANGTGRGGFAEVSGKDLWLLGSVNVGSAQGVGGTILLDPTDITIVDGAGGTFDGQLPSPNGAGAGTVSVTAMQGQSAVQLIASNNVLYTGNGFNLGATSLSVDAGNDILFTTNGPIQATALTLVAGRDIVITNNNGDLTLASNSGALSLQAGSDLSLTARDHLFISSPAGTTLTATTGNLNTSSRLTGGYLTRLSGPRTDLVAGGNLTIAAQTLDQSGDAPVFINGGNVTLQNPSADFNLRVGALNVTANQNFLANATGNLLLSGQNGSVNVTAGSSLTVDGSGGAAVVSNTDRLTLTAANLQVRGQNGGATLRGAQGVNATASIGDLSVSAGGGDLNLAGGSGAVTLTAGRDMSLTSSDHVFLSSGAANRLAAGRDLTTSSRQAGGYLTRLSGPQTDLVAGRNLQLTAQTVDQSGDAPVFINGGNVTLQNPGAGLSLRVGALNVTANENFLANANGNLQLSGQNGPVNVTAGSSLTVDGNGAAAVVSSTNRVTLTAASLQVRGQNGAATLQGAQGVNATASIGDLSVSAAGGDLNLAGGSGAVTLTAGRDVSLTSSDHVFLSSGTGNRLEAGRDLTTSSRQAGGYVTRLSGPQTDLVAGRNLQLTAQTVDQSGDAPVFMNGSNVTLQNPGAGLSLRVGALNVTANENFLANANGNLQLSGQNGPVNVTAGSSLTVDGNGAAAVVSSTNRVTLTAASLQVRGQNGAATLQAAQGVNATASTGDLSVSAGGGDLNLAGGSGAVTLTAGRDMSLTSSDHLFVSSSAGNRLEAGRDLTTSSRQAGGYLTRLSGPQTDLVAGRNLQLTAQTVDQSGDAPVFINGGNVTLQNPGAGLSLRVGALNVTANENFLANATGTLQMSGQNGPINVTAGSSLTIDGVGAAAVVSNTDRITLTAASLQVRGQNGAANLQAAQGVNATASTGDLSVSAGAGDLNLAGGSGAVTLTAGRDLSLTSSDHLFVSSGTGNRLEAGRDLTTGSRQAGGYLTRLNGPQTDLVTGRNLQMTAQTVNQSEAAPVFINGGNVTLQNPTAEFNLQVGALNVTANQNFAGNASGSFNLRTLSGPLSITTGADFSVAASSAGVRADTGGVSLTAGDLALSNVAVQSVNGPLSLASSGNLSVGSLATNSNANATLTGANIIIQSMQNVSGGNYTITTPGNLTEITPATNPPQLAALNITAGRIFNLNAPDLGFSVPQTGAGNLTALVTGGNETTVNPVQAASFSNFGTANVNPGHIEFQTGDIYVDGVQVYGGRRAPNPPEPPAPPPVPPSLPVDAPPIVVEPSLVREATLNPEERSQILAQSNLALGNLGSFSRVLSDSERAQITARHDSLHQTWSLDPFSPTLALTVPGGGPAVYASELAQLQALLMMSSPSDDPEDKNRQAYNVIVDQELREIWEVRYFRHLLEHFIIWEDRE